MNGWQILRAGRHLLVRWFLAMVVFAAMAAVANAIAGL